MENMRPHAHAKRSLSSANISAAEKIHEYIEIQYNAVENSIPILNRDVIKSTMILPQQYDTNVLLLCVDEPMLLALQQQMIINWCKSSRFLLPLYMEDDGNSCLHSISTYIFGVQDKNLVLRKLCQRRLAMEKPGQDGLFQRWLINHRRVLERLLRYNREEYIVGNELEWHHIVSQTSVRTHENSHGQQIYSELDSIHIFTMANILGRAVIVLSDPVAKLGDLDSVKSAELNGIYLPLLRSCKDVEKSPIILGYKNNRFAPLLSSENSHIELHGIGSPAPSALHCLPIVHENMTPLSVKFLLPQEEGLQEKLIMQYLDLCDVTFDENNALKAAWLKFKPPPAYSIELMWSLHQLAEVEKQKNETDPIVKQPIYDSLIPCARKDVKDCPYYAAGNKENLCVACFEQYTEEKRKIPKRPSNQVKKTKANQYQYQYEDMESFVTSSKSHGASARSNGSFLSKCTTPGCNGIPFDIFHNQCRECYTKSVDFHPKDVDNKPYISAVSPLLPSKVRSEIPQPVIPTSDKAYIPAVSPLLPPNVRSEIPETVTSSAADKPYIPAVSPLLPSEEQRNLTRRPKSTVSKPEPGNQPTEPRVNDLSRVNTFQRVHQQLPENNQTAQPGGNKLNSTGNNLQAVGHKQDSIRNIRGKLFCEIPGCQSPRVSEELCCEYHLSTRGKRERCISCDKLSDVNKDGVCTLCFRTQNRLLHQAVQQPLNIPRGAVDVASLPPQPEVPLSSLPPQPMFDEQIRNDYLNTQQQQQQKPFEPPSLYEGFPRGNIMSYGNQHGVTNWQKQQISKSQPSSLEQDCRYCNNKAQRGRNGLCGRCFEHKKDDTASTHASLKKCINDGCRSPGNPEYAYFCDTCHMKQMTELKQIQDEQQLHQQQQQQQQRQQQQRQQLHQQQQQQQEFQGCITVGCPRLAILPSKVCETCKINFHNYGTDISRNEAHEAQQERRVDQPADKIKCKGLDCDFFASPEYGGYCSTCFMETTKENQQSPFKHNGIRTYAPPSLQQPQQQHQPQQQQHNYPLSMGAFDQQAVHCKSIGCDCFGRPEWNGYCSICFKNQRQSIERDAIAV